MVKKRARIKVRSEQEFERWRRLAEKRRSEADNRKSITARRDTARRESLEDRRAIRQDGSRSLGCYNGHFVKALGAVEMGSA